ARETAVPARVHGRERLRRDLRPVPRRGDPRTDRGLRAAASVGVGRVDPAEAELPGRVHDRERLLLRLTLPEELRRRADPAEIAAAEDDLVWHVRAKLHR